jgi:hypothetical protein
VFFKPECPLLVKVYLKTPKNTHILKFFIGNIIFARNVMQCAYKCTVFKLLNRSVISPLVGNNWPDPVLLKIGVFTGLFGSQLDWSGTELGSFTNIQDNFRRWETASIQKSSATCSS